MQQVGWEVLCAYKKATHVRVVESTPSGRTRRMQRDRRSSRMGEDCRMMENQLVGKVTFLRPKGFEGSEVVLSDESRDHRGSG